MANRALLVIDMQNDFAHPKGRLFLKNNLKIIPRIKKEIENCRRKKIKIFFTKDWHKRNDKEFKIWPKHCLENSWGAEIVKELTPQKEDIIIKKRTYSAFFETDLDKILKKFKIKKLIFTGCVTNICVLFTAFDAFKLDYEILLKEDCLGYIDKKSHNFALSLMKKLFLAKYV